MLVSLGARSITLVEKFRTMAAWSDLEQEARVAGVGLRRLEGLELPGPHRSAVIGTGGWAFRPGQTTLWRRRTAEVAQDFCCVSWSEACERISSAGRGA